MSESNEQIGDVMSTSSLPPRIALEDFIEAVTRGINRAIEAQTDDTGGFALSQAGLSIINRPILIGIILPPGQLPGQIGGQVGGVGRGSPLPGTTQPLR